MKINGLGKELNDNDVFYINIISLVLYYSDPFAELTLEKTHSELKAIINPSKEEFRQEIIDNIVSLHRILMIKPEFSKSTKIEKNIYYSICLT